MQTPSPSDDAPPALRLDNIQGNSIGGFNKDFVTLLFLKFKAADKARAWIGEIAQPEGLIAGASSKDVLKFNAQFKALKAAGVKPEAVISATWTNLAISHKGLAALGLNAADLASFPDEFKQGMAARKQKIGDLGASDPQHWLPPFQYPGDVHAVLIVASDSDDDLQARVNDIKADPAFSTGVTIVDADAPVKDVVAGRVEGRTRVDEMGHEHFGFKDGVSQPGIRGVTPPDDPLGNPDQGQPGQDLLWPGEFVLGYPKQIGTKGEHSPNKEAGEISTSGPAWTVDGSYFVFRRLAQDVAGFRSHVEELAKKNGLSHDLMGAKLVGRYKSGCPVETRAFEAARADAPSEDPGRKNPALADSDTLNNNFEFGEDADGAICPLAAHIRKAYPRDEQTLPVKGNKGTKEDSESDTQTHRLLRRGIPFGESYGKLAAGEPNHYQRGLLFMCYQTDIARQFEFVQSQWVNDREFPEFPDKPKRPTPGQDPIIAQSPHGSFTLYPDKPPIDVKHFVTTTGGEYFLAPSIAALQKIGRSEIA